MQGKRLALWLLLAGNAERYGHMGMASAFSSQSWLWWACTAACAFCVVPFSVTVYRAGGVEV